MTTTMVYEKRRHTEMQEVAQQPPVETEKKQKKFSPEATEYFGKMGIKIEELNRLDLTKFPQSKIRDYVDYLKQADMTDGMMSFIDDNGKGDVREGVALLITGDLINIGKETCVKASGVLSIFQRIFGGKEPWAKGFGLNPLISQMEKDFKARHMAGVRHVHTYDCPGFMPGTIPVDDLKKVVQDEDPDYKIWTPPKEDDIKMEDEDELASLTKVLGFKIKN